MNEQERSVGTIYPSLSYDDASTAIAWLCRAFGFEMQLVVPGPGGTVRHSELSCDGGVVMVSSANPEKGRVSPRSLGRVSQALSVRILDPDAHFARAKAAGAKIIEPLRDETYGSRGYMAEDLEGHQWYFGTYSPGAHWGKKHE